MNKLLIVILTCIIFVTCDHSKPKIDYTAKVDTLATIDDRIGDTTKLIVAQLPVKFDSTDVLIYPVGMVDLQQRGGISKYGSGSYNDFEFGSNYFSGNHLSGDFINLVFQDPDGKRRSLTRNKMKVKSAIFLRDIFKITKRGYLIYSVYDRDTNGDKEFNGEDLEALYISDVDGTKFTKITRELHEFYDYRVLEGDNKLYFRTLEDNNKDGKLNNKDKFHYYFIDFSNSGYSVAEHNPLEVFE